MNLTTGYSSSLIRNGLPMALPKLEKSLKTDVVIIGGGISGALTAYYLVNTGIDCVVVDARTIGLDLSRLAYFIILVERLPGTDHLQLSCCQVVLGVIVHFKRRPVNNIKMLKFASCHEMSCMILFWIT